MRNYEILGQKLTTYIIAVILGMVLAKVSNTITQKGTTVETIKEIK